jgi:hypothetical protein
VFLASGCALWEKPDNPDRRARGFASDAKGLVLSPFWPHPAIDATGLKPGTPLLCPATKRVFLVP